MTDYSKWKLAKENLDKNIDQYSAVAEWCNESGQYHIEDDGIYYVVVKNPEKSQQEKEEDVRMTRNLYLQDYDFTQLADAPFTEEEKQQFAEYRQYLRDYTKTENWWLSNPKTFEEWKKTVDNILD